MKTRKEIVEYARKSSFGLLHRCHISAVTDFCHWYTFYLRNSAYLSSLTVDMAGQLFTCRDIAKFTLSVHFDPTVTVYLPAYRTAHLSFRCSKVMPFVPSRSRSTSATVDPFTVRLLWQDKPCVTFTVANEHRTYFTVTPRKRYAYFYAQGPWVEMISGLAPHPWKEQQ